MQMTLLIDGQLVKGEGMARPVFSSVRYVMVAC